MKTKSHFFRGLLFVLGFPACVTGWYGKASQRKPSSPWPYSQGEKYAAMSGIHPRYYRAIKAKRFPLPATLVIGRNGHVHIRLPNGQVLSQWNIKPERWMFWPRPMFLDVPQGADGKASSPIQSTAT